MTGLLGNVLPWPNANKKEKATNAEPTSSNETTSAETTKGGSEFPTWIRVAENLNPGEAVVIKGRLDSEDIPAIVQQEAVGSVLGLTVGPLGSARISVPEPLVERALAILAETFEDDESEVEDDSLAS